MPKPFAWSYSALNAFETCPRQFQETRLLKRWPQPPSEAQTYGKLCHSYIEDRINAGKPLPVFLRHVEPIVARLEQSKGEVQAEYKYALDAQFQPVEFFAPTAWVRAVGDVVKVHENRAFALDWKTGKYREGDEQLRIQGNVMFCTYPHLEQVSVAYVWLKDKRVTTRVYERSEVPGNWQRFLPRVQRMEQAAKDQDYPPRPSGLCRKHCPVTTCQFHGKGAY